MSDDYADGGVHTLTQGSSELQTILGAAARRNQLVLVDFSASWCGPCRMMLPVLQRLAQELRGRLAVVKVDCEQTSTNQALASSSGIRAFPTFHLYRSQQKVAEMRGADPAGLRRAIDQQLALLGPSSGGASSSGGAGGMSAAGMAMCNALAQALARVKAACSYDEFVAATKTLLTFVGNVADKPGEERYRRVKVSNAAYQSKLGCRPGGKDAMAAIGFKEMMEAGEAVLLMSEVPSELPRVRQLLQSALQQAEAAAAGAAAAERRAGAAAAAGAMTAAAPAPPPAAAPALAPAAAPAGTAPLSIGVPAAGGAGASTAAGGATGVGASTSGAVDVATLSRALAAAMGGGSGAAAAAGGAWPAAGAAAAGRGPGKHRLVQITPRRLARVLEKCLAQIGIGQVAQQAQQGGSQDGGQP